MRRNNGWLAVLAVSLALSILRNSLAGERHPLDYGNAELPVNRSNTAYKPSSRSQNPSESSPQIPRSNQQKGVVPSSEEAAKPIPYPTSDRSLVQKTNRPIDEDPVVYDPSFPKYENPRESKLVQGSRPAIETRLRESTGLRPHISQQPSLSSWIPRAAINGRSGRINPAKLGYEPTRGRKTTTQPPPVTIRGGAVLDEGASYYGHVVSAPSDDESLTISGAPSIHLVKGSTSRDPPDLEIERSDEVNGVETVSGQVRDIGSSNLRLHDGKIVRKRYLTGYSLLSISVSRRASKNSRNKLTLDSTRRRLKNRRRGARSIHHDWGDGRARGSIKNLGRRVDGESRINLDTWYFSRHADRDSRNDGFDKGYRRSSRMEDLKRGISGGSMEAVSGYESTRQLNGTSKRILGMDNDREGAGSIDARRKRNIVSVDDGVGFESSSGEENSWNVTLYGASNGVDNMEQELKFDFSRDNVTDDLLDDRMFSPSVTNVDSKPDNESYFVRRSIGENSNVDGSKESSLNSSRLDGSTSVKNIGAKSVDGLEDSSAWNSSKSGNESYSTSRNIGTNFKVNGLNDCKSVRNVSKLDDGWSVVGENSVDGSITNENYSVLMSNDSTSRDASTNLTKEMKLEKSSVPDGNRSTINESDSIRYDASLNGAKLQKESNIQGGNVDTSGTNNEFRSISHDDTITDSINGTKLRDLNTSNGNYSQLMENKFRWESRQNIITDLINDTPNKSYLHINDKSHRFIVQDTNGISNSSNEKQFTALNFPDTIDRSLDSNDEASDKTTRENDMKFNSSAIINSKGGKQLACNASKTIDSNSKLANSNNESMGRNESEDRMDGTELGTWWAEVDRSGEASIKPVSQETSMLSSATKESKNAFENSVGGSVAAPRNATYLKHDTNSLAEGGFVFESTGLFEFEGKNAGDPFEGSPTGRKLVENSSKSSNSNALPERASINHEMGSKQSGEPSNIRGAVVSRRNEDARKKIKGGERESRESSSSNGYNEAKDFQGSLNEFLIVSGGKKSEEGLGLIEENLQRIMEPIAFVSPSKNEGEQVITINSLDDGITDNMDDIDDRPISKGRKSRSWKVGANTNSKYNPTAQDRANDQTSASTWNKDGIVPNNVPTPSIDSSVNGPISEPNNGIRETLELPEFISNSSFRSTISFSSATKDDHLTSLSDVTLSPIEIEQLPTSTLINEEEKGEGEDRSYVTPFEANYQDFRATVDSISRNADNSSQTETEPQWPVKHSAVVEGDLVLGGLMMVHEREDNVTCGPVMPQGGVQALEAMLYTLDKLNDRGIVPGVKIGAHILDDCDKDTYGLEMAVDFIKGKFIYLDSGPVDDSSMVINARLYSQLPTDTVIAR